MSGVHTAGAWSHAESPVYFLAGSVGSVSDIGEQYPYLLVAVNELEGAASLRQLERWIDAGARVLLDSGVFWLSTSHAKAHGLTMDQALSAAPEDVDGFDGLFKRYCEIVDRFGDRLWGYIEIDQGGEENKRRTRARLEDRGYRPIPVYHPLVDTEAYFDELAERYDRMCFGNVVQADAVTRRRLISSMWERRRRYPNLWIHVLGYTPDDRLHAWSADSADSSTWLGAMRWPIGGSVKCSGKTFGQMEPELRYRVGSERWDRDGCGPCAQLQAREALSEMRGWKHALARQAEVIGADPRGTVEP